MKDYPELNYDSKRLRSFANALDNQLKEKYWSGFAIGWVAGVVITLFITIIL